jgi:integrase
MLYVDYYVDGKRMRRSTKLSDSKENRKFIEKNIIPKMQAKILLGEYGQNKIQRLSHYRELFLDDKKELVTYRPKKKRTDVIMDFFKDIPVDRIKRSDVKLFLKSLSCGNVTKKEYLTDLRGIINVAFDDEIIDKNPCMGIKIGEIESPEVDPFDSDEIKRILEGCEDPVFCNYLGIAFHMGMRSGEIIGLMHSDISSDTMHIRRSISRGRIGPPKTKASKREIPILESALPYIVDQMKRSQSLYLFHRDQQYLYDIGSFRDPWVNLLKKIGIRHRKLYNTRHSFISAMLNSGKSPVLDIAKYVGNSPKIIFKNYAGWVKAERVKIDTTIDLYGHDSGIHEKKTVIKWNCTSQEVA